MTASTTGAYEFYATTDSGFLGESMSVFAPPEVRSTDDALDADQTTKTHAACDECRKRKLKCSGELSGCVRCVKQNLSCYYSTQKQMGRPKKRQRTDHDEPARENSQTKNQSTPETSTQLAAEPAIDPSLTAKIIERTNFENICNAPMVQTIKRATRDTQEAVSMAADTTPHLSQTSTSATTLTPSPLNVPTTPSQGITDLTGDQGGFWPDFSDMPMLPVVVSDAHKQDHSVPFSIPHADPTSPFCATSNDRGQASSHAQHPQLNAATLANLPAIPECPCLPNLYLTASTLSALSAFPVSSGTIDTLRSSHRTNHDSIYCGVCPKKFQSGSQNVMMNSMLLSIIGDHWHRVRKATALDLKKGFGSDEAQGQGQGERASNPTDPTTPELSVLEDLEWRTFGHNLIRAHVFGDAPIPTPPSSSKTLPPPTTTTTTTTTVNATTSAQARYSTLPLMKVFSSFERRQKEWHGLTPWSGEFPCEARFELSSGHTVGMTLAELRKCENGLHADHGDADFLCLRIVDGARRVLSALDTPPPTVGG